MPTGKWLAAVLLLALATPAAARERMRGFEALAAGAEQVEITGLSGWHKGKFRLGDTGLGGRYDIVSRRAHEYGESAHFGGSSFTLTGPGLDGNYAGRCSFERIDAQERMRAGSLKLTLSSAVVPLSYRCEFLRDGAVIGTLDLREVASRKMSVKQEREGSITFGGRILDVRSIHYFENGKLPGASPLGYILEEQGRAVAAADLNGGRKHLALPREPGLREAALLSSMALALFWDPGDD